MSSCESSVVLGWGYGCFGVFDCIRRIGRLWIIPVAPLMWGYVAIMCCSDVRLIIGYFECFGSMV